MSPLTARAVLLYGPKIISITTSQGVTFTSGTYQVDLGAICAFTTTTCENNSNTAVDWNSYPLYLSLQIGNTSNCSAGNPGSALFTADCGGDGVMNPFVLLTSTPYALNSGQLGGFTASQFIQTTPASTQTIQPTANVSSLLIDQNSSGSFGQDIFDIQGSSGGSNNFLQVTSTAANQGAVTLQSLGSNALSLQSGGVLNIGTTAASSVNIGAVGSTALASTVNIATSSDTGSTQTVNIGSSAKSTSLITLNGNTRAAITTGSTVTVGINSTPNAKLNVNVGSNVAFRAYEAGAYDIGQFAETGSGVGTVTANGTTAIVGSSTSFTQYFRVGDAILIGSQLASVATITDDTHLTTSVSITTGSGLAYTNGTVGAGTVTTNGTTAIVGSSTTFLPRSRWAILYLLMVNRASVRLQALPITRT